METALCPYTVDSLLEKPSDDDLHDTTEKTRQALQKLTNSKIAAALPVRCAPKPGAAQFIRYTPSEQSVALTSDPKQRIIRLVEAQVDPLEPPRFQINAKIPRAPPSPPAPVLHSPTRRVTAKEQKEWKIPPCVSNWKNAKGYTVPLDKRLAADGRGLQKAHINEKFAKLAEALYIADRKAREAVETRAQLERKLAQKEKEAKEEHLRILAQKARDERSSFLHKAANSMDKDENEREKLRQERHKERARERNIARANPEKRTQLQRERDRDVSEMIALDMPPKTNIGIEAQFDQRLFAQNPGLSQGFNDDEVYNVYDKPWRGADSLATHLYRPRNVDNDMFNEEDIDQLAKTVRFVPYKEFSGTNRNAEPRTGPVQFEKEDDPFGLDTFLTEAKRASVSKRKDDSTQSGSSKRKR